MQYQGIIFDLDGTLIDSAADLVHAVQALLKKHDLPVKSDEEIKSYIGKGLPNLLQQSLDGNMTVFHDIYAEFLAYYSQHCVVHTCLYPGVLETLERLSGMPMAVLTNKDQAQTEKILTALELRGFFVSVLGGDQVLHKKPDPWGIHTLLARLELPADRVLLVGDSEHDVEAGKRASVDTCFVTYGIGKDRNGEAQYRVDDFRDILKILCI